MCLVRLPRCHLDLRLPPRLTLTRATAIPCFALKPRALALSSLVGWSNLVTAGSRLQTCILSHKSSPIPDSSGFFQASLMNAYIDFIVFSNLVLRFSLIRPHPCGTFSRRFWPLTSSLWLKISLIFGYMRATIKYSGGLYPNIYKALNTLYKGEIMVNTTEPKKTIKIENVVASTAIGAKLDLNEVIRVLEGADYNKERFPGLVYRLSVPKVVMLLFGSGKLVVTGGKKPEDAEAAVEKIVIELDGLGLL